MVVRSIPCTFVLHGASVHVPRDDLRDPSSGEETPWIWSCTSFLPHPSRPIVPTICSFQRGRIPLKLNPLTNPGLPVRLDRYLRDPYRYDREARDAPSIPWRVVGEARRRDVAAAVRLWRSSRPEETHWDLQRLRGS